MSGAVAERINLYGYAILCGAVNSVIYAFVAHWIWSADGFLYNWGFYDFAGCGVVHMTGGVAGIAGTFALSSMISLVVPTHIRRNVN